VGHEQNNLGNTLAALGGRESDIARSSRLSKPFRRRCWNGRANASRSDWAITQNSSALRWVRSLSMRATSRGSSRPSKPFRRRCWNSLASAPPVEWASGKNNLGKMRFERSASMSAAPRGSEQAVEAYKRRARMDWTRPADWAGTQSNLGSALRVLGERDSGTGAARAGCPRPINAACSNNTRERSPSLGWTQNNLGTALQALGDVRAAPRGSGRPSKPFRRRCSNGQGSADLGMRSLNALDALSCFAGKTPEAVGRRWKFGPTIQRLTRSDLVAIAAFVPSWHETDMPLHARCPLGGQSGKHSSQ